ncbi:hypothetical protein DEDE109153_05785 [Deinococcus deserti]|uniref:Lipoprotein n=1 Tax=Deinococcus deserti (strain DSM 17065 / CIP 109153 / LMG 22923 / VCD115) TaxID=546414 RepID=C1CYS3_DEIDV|nr:hypothetical protein [Deinococcus deserti]ACO47103.1 hypothetical protein Deide_20821 [Deinococcus deserti VCD115]
MAKRHPLRCLGLVLMLSACDPQGLDLYDPVDARDYARSCARGREDVYCEALLPTLAGIQGPASLIMPNIGDQERAAHLARLLGEKGMTVDTFLRRESAKAAFARANIFPVARLTTGIHATLDGKLHQVVCKSFMHSPALSHQDCQIDHLGARNALAHRRPTSDSVYLTTAASQDISPFFWF